MKVAGSPSLIRPVSGGFDVSAFAASAPRSRAQFGAPPSLRSATNQYALPSANGRSPLTSAIAEVSSSPKTQAFDLVTDTQWASGRPRRFVLINDTTAPSLLIATNDARNSM